MSLRMQFPHLCYILSVSVCHCKPHDYQRYLQPFDSTYDTHQERTPKQSVNRAKDLYFQTEEKTDQYKEVGNKSNTHMHTAHLFQTGHVPLSVRWTCHEHDNLCFFNQKLERHFKHCLFCLYRYEWAPIDINLSERTLNSVQFTTCSLLDQITVVNFPHNKTRSIENLNKCLW